MGIKSTVLPDISRGDRQGHLRLAMLSHDIRLAMSDVIGGLRLVDLSGLDEATRLQLERVRTSSEALARLMDETLVLATDGTESGLHVKATLHLHRFLNEMELRWSAHAKSKNLSFRLVIDPDVPPIVHADRMAIDRILSNLLSNALKYTEKGAVTLSVDVRPGNELRFVVRDAGPGFSDAALARLFEANGRPYDTIKPGSGLGLHIAKENADELGGHLTVSNAIDGGAEVTLLLPNLSWQLSLPRPSDKPLPDLKDKRVLIAEDNETNLLLMAQMLQTMGAEYELAHDGVDALNWMMRERFDLALIDIEMPRLSGLEVMRAIRAGENGHADMPILAVTAYVMRANREEIYAAGANGILAKPIMSVEAFGQSISALLNPLSEAPEGDADGETTPIDRGRFEHLLSIAGPKAEKELLARIERDLQAVADGLEDGFANKDIPEIRAHSHVLISLAGAVGAARLQHYAGVLNAAAHAGDMAKIGSISEETKDQVVDLVAVVHRERQERHGAV